MTLKPLLHVMLLGLWGGCVAVELVLEFAAAKSPELQPVVARFHDAIDRKVEIPLLVLIVASGLWLLQDANLSDPWLWVKIAAGMTAIAANALCVIPVVRRKRAADAGSALSVLQGHARGVFLSAAIGVPAASVALVLGLMRALGR